MSSVYEQTRVIKRLGTTQPGAIKLARRYGASLVCVRHRRSPDGLTRYTTVEIVVDEAPISKRQVDDGFVQVKLQIHELELRQQLLSRGGKWDIRARVWKVARHVVEELDLTDRVIAK